VIDRAKCPANAVQVQTVSDVDVGADEDGIIQGNEAKAAGPEINNQSDRDEK
jgi:hypothetical protein